MKYMQVIYCIVMQKFASFLYFCKYSVNIFFLFNIRQRVSDSVSNKESFQMFVSDDWITFATILDVYKLVL